jgi:hypothetical protein
MAGVKISASTSPGALLGTEIFPLYKPGQAGSSKFGATLDAMKTYLDSYGATFVRVANFSALPSAAANPDEYYHVLASQGTAWLPGPLGGTYYSKGFYYSDGVIWTFVGEVPYQATQGNVDAGSIADQFVSPLTLNNYARWAPTTTIVTAATHNETATKGNVVILCDPTGNAITVNLPTAVGNDATITIKRITGGANAVTVDALTTETIDDGLTASLVIQYESITIVSDNTEWVII